MWHLTFSSKYSVTPVKSFALSIVSYSLVGTTLVYSNADCLVLFMVLHRSCVIVLIRIGYVRDFSKCGMNRKVIEMKIQLFYCLTHWTLFLKYRLQTFSLRYGYDKNFIISCWGPVDERYGMEEKLFFLAIFTFEGWIIILQYVKNYFYSFNDL